MKKINLAIVFLLSTWTMTTAQTYCLGYEITSLTATNVTVELKLQGSTSFKLGSSNIRFNYNSNALTVPVDVNNFVTSLNLATSALTTPSPYDVIRATLPSSSTVRYNASLSSPNTGATIAATPSWTNLGRITFDITDNTQTSGFSFNPSASVVFLDNETTIISEGSGCPTLNVVLPLELLSFDVKKSGKTAILDWTAVHAVGMSAFEVQRSADGQKFETIGEVKAVNTTDKKTYQFVDAQPTEGVNFYRLRMREMDGKAGFSAIKSAAFGKDFSMKAYPNPTSDWTTVDVLGATENGEVNVELTDLSGRVVLQQKVQCYNGIGQYRLDLRDLAAGVYTLKAFDNGKVIQQKIAKQ